MCRFIETVRIENRRLCNIDIHSRRMNRTRRMFFDSSESLDLKKLIEIPDKYPDGKIKCRIMYSDRIENIEFLPYSLKKAEKVRLVSCNSIDYSYKSTNRKEIEELFSMKGDCDDILIVKNNLITDLSFANAVFYDGNNFYTPSEPLLEGTMREKLLLKRKITEIKITPSDLSSFETLFPINAMIDLGDIVIPVLNIIR